MRRRPFTALAALGTAAHHAFEVNGGVGLVFEPFLGRRGAVALWLGLLPGQVVFALTRDARFDRPLALGNGAALAGGLVHFAEWPWELRHGIPALTEAEGMTADRVPAYNLVLQSWVLAAALALVLETPRRALPWAVAGLASFEPLRHSARHHFRWARERAREDPAAWSPALRD